MRINDNINFDQNCIDELFNIEGRILHPFLDKSGLWTIGIGHVIKETDSFSCLSNDQVREMLKTNSEESYVDFIIPEQEALDILINDINTCLEAIKENVKNIPLNQNQVNALIFFLINIGIKWIQEGSVKEALDEGNYDQVCVAILDLYKSEINGEIVEVEELLYRRRNEAALFAKPLDEIYYNILNGLDETSKNKYYISIARIKSRFSASHCTNKK